MTDWYSGRYMDEFVKLKAAPDLLTRNLFPNAKEITESMGAYNAVRRFADRINLKFDDENVKLISVGDGITPRTAALFAFRSRWSCHSVDPELRKRNQIWGIDRLKIWPNKIEDITFKFGENERIIIVAVHSHALLPDALKAAGNRADMVVAMPCCISQKLWRREDFTYRDMSIASPCREVKIWINLSSIS